MNKQTDITKFFAKSGNSSEAASKSNTKKRELSPMKDVETETPKEEVKQATKQRKVNPEKKEATPKKAAEVKPKAKTNGKKAKDVEEEKKPIEEVKTASTSTGNDQSLKQPVATVGDCLDSYENFISELGDWKEPLEAYLKNPAFKQTYQFVKEEYATQTIYPPKHLIFNAFKHVPFSQLKVVIVGQDPYIKEGEAMGLCFSIPKNIKCPPSLKNIYKALEEDNNVSFKTPNPIHGDLSKWAGQGVLLLNAILTVRKGISNSHQKKGWEAFTDHVIRTINNQKEGVVFLLWGGKAQEKASSVNASKHCVLKFVHPSPLAGTGFSACKHFSQCNDYLKSKGKQPIDWNV